MRIGGIGSEARDMMPLFTLMMMNARQSHLNLPSA